MQFSYGGASCFKPTAALDEMTLVDKSMGAVLAWAAALCVAADPVAPGFTLSVLTDDVPNARQMALADSGLLFVGTRRAGKVYAVVPPDDDGADSEVVTIASGLAMPSGVALFGSDLYVAALDRVLRYRDIEATYRDKPRPEIVTDELPDRRHHGWKYLSVGPDGFLYVPVGAPCNVCKSDDPRFASILRMDPATGETTVYAHGVRNSVGMAWHPDTEHLWFTDNGRDMLGDDVPPEEVNVAVEVGAHYGYPHVHGRAILDPGFGDGHDPANYVPPEVEIQAHSAALGLAFYTHSAFPAEYAGALFIRRARLVEPLVEGRLPRQRRTFRRGWAGIHAVHRHLAGGERASGRPNDVLVAADGSLLISDDQGGRIYRATYTGTE